MDGDSILYVPCTPAEFAHREGLSEQELHDRIMPLRQQILAHRNRRVPPDKDDKILAAWNGMAIAALARGYQAFGENRYLEAAEQAASFILNEMIHDGLLLRSYRGCRDGSRTKTLPGYLDDYAEVSCALIDLYEAGFDRRWLAVADRLVGRMLTDFWDEERGGFYYTSAAHRNVLVRTKPLHDGPTPSGNSTAALVLLRLSKLLDNSNYLNKAKILLASVAVNLRDQPHAHMRLLCAVDFCLSSVLEIVIAGRRDSEDTRRLLEIIQRKFIPNKILTLIDPDEDSGLVGPAIPGLAGKQMLSGRPAVYVCRDSSCLQPITEESLLTSELDNLVHIP